MTSVGWETCKIDDRVNVLMRDHPGPRKDSWLEKGETRNRSVPA